MLDKLERKLGRYAIPHLINYLLIGYAIGYAFTLFGGRTALSYMTLEPYFVIHGQHGFPEIWRIITWVCVPPFSMSSFIDIIFALIMFYFYWQLGTVLERQWGTFRFNVYIFGGILFTLVGAFLYYGIYTLATGTPTIGIGSYTSTSYINMSIFLAFAMSYPDMTVLLYFIIPIKMKWMAIVYAVITVWQIISLAAAHAWAGCVAIVCSLLNFLIFFLSTRNFRRIDPREIHRQNEFKRQMNAGRNANWYQQSGFGGQAGGRTNARGNSGQSRWSGQNGQQNAHGGSWGFRGRQNGGEIARHKCAICGRTELTNPELEFRFCSKCNGNYEYCNDHLFTHQHRA